MVRLVTDEDGGADAAGYAGWGGSCKGTMTDGDASTRCQNSTSASRS